jgi:DNA-binding FadR family transcriptional regulator
MTRQSVIFIASSGAAQLGRRRAARSGRLVRWSDHLTTVYAGRYDGRKHRAAGVAGPSREHAPREKAPEIPQVPLTAVEPRRLYRQIADQIAQLISSGEFPAGSRLPAERELAVSLGVSRTSVREAIISLEMSGLVEVRVGTGIFVTVPEAQAPADRGDAGPGPFELLEARRLIEGETAALAARNGTREDFDALAQSVAFMEAHVEDFAAREAADREFHLRVAKATGNGSLELVVAGLWDQRAELWGRLQRHFHTSDLARQTIRDHAAIAKAIAARDPDAARAAMHRHISRVAREFQRGVDVGATRAPGVAPPQPARHVRRHKATQ